MMRDTIPDPVEALMLVVDIPSRNGQLRHPLPGDPTQVERLVCDLLPFVPLDASWFVSDRWKAS